MVDEPPIGLDRLRVSLDAPRGDCVRLAPGVATLTLAPLIPTFVQDDERFR